MPDPLDLTFAVLRGESGPAALAAAARALDEPDAEIQLRAVVLLLERSEPEGMAALRRRFESLLPPAREALLRDEGAFLRSLQAALKDPSAEVRTTAVACLAGLARGEALQGLVSALEDEAEPVRERAAKGLDRLSRELPRPARVADPESEPAEGRTRELAEALLVALRSYRQHRRGEILEAALRVDAGAHRALLNIMADPGDPRRDDLLAILGVSGEPAAPAFLFKMLRDPRERLRDDAAKALSARRGDPAFQKALVSLLDQAPSKYVPRLAASLASVPWWPDDAGAGFPALAHHLAALLKEARQLSGPDRMAKLKALLGLPEAGVRAQAALQLSALGEAGAQEALWEVLDDPEEAVQSAALRALAGSDHPQKRRILASKLNHPSPAIQAIAREALSREGFHQYLASLPRMDGRTRQAAAQALAKLDPELVKRIEAELASAEPDRRLRALQLLNVVERGRELVPSLLDLVKDPDRRVRASAIRSLAAAGTLEALRALVRGLADPDRRVRANAIEAVGRVGDARMGRLLLPFLNGPDPRCRANAVQALWRMGQHGVVSHLEAMLQDGSEGVRLSAVWALGQLDWAGRAAHLGHLAQSDPSTRVRAHARRILAGEAPP